MTCREIDDLMISGPGNPLREPGAIEHLIECSDCRSLTCVLNEQPEAALPERHVKRIRESIPDRFPPVRPLAKTGFLLLACAIICLFIVAIGATPFGLIGWGVLSVGQKIAVFGTLAAGSVLLAVSMVGQMVPGSRYALAAAALPVAILSTLLILIALSFQSQAESAFVADGMACLKNGFTYSFPAGFLFWLLVRHGAVLFPRLIGAAAGGLAGLVGLSVLEINCPNLNLFHILVWHWGVVLISSLAGAVIGAAAEYAERRERQRVSAGLGT